VSAIRKYKTGFFYSQEFVADNSWNGYEHDLMFESLGNGQFADVARPLGCEGLEDSRGCAIADLNGDGRQDIVVSNNADPPIIYLNRMSSAGNWARLELCDRSTENRHAVGAKVSLALKEGEKLRTLTRVVEVGSGFASQSELTLHFGLGQHEAIEKVEVAWPDGAHERISASDLPRLVNSSVGVVRNAGGLVVVPSRALAARSGSQVARGPEIKP
jgi:hypothetical protein